MGYIYGGWNSKADGTGTSYSDKKSIKNLTATQGATVNLYAQWKPVGYSVNFNGNGNTPGSMANQSFVYNKERLILCACYKSFHASVTIFNDVSDFLK
ncbi:MAG: hypothetical protein K6C36_00990 [Clostridia bacterium]|nr:hypothetical protein [Clostridia bacterium]